MESQIWYGKNQLNQAKTRQGQIFGPLMNSNPQTHALYIV